MLGEHGSHVYTPRWRNIEGLADGVPIYGAPIPVKYQHFNGLPF